MLQRTRIGVVIALALVAGLWGAAAWLDRRSAAIERRAEAAGHLRGSTEVQQRWDQAEARRREADDKARKEQETRARKEAAQAMEAANAARKREQDLRLAAARARAERDGLRNELAASQRDLRTAACDAVRERAAALTDIFGACTAALEGMAESAGRHASDSLMYQQAWPR